MFQRKILALGLAAALLGGCCQTTAPQPDVCRAFVEALRPSPAASTTARPALAECRTVTEVTVRY